MCFFVSTAAASCLYPSATATASFSSSRADCAKPALPARRATPAAGISAIRDLLDLFMVFSFKLTESFLANASVGGKGGVRRKATPPVRVQLGRITLSMTWITPLSATMSTAVTFASFTLTPPMVETLIAEPCTDFTIPAFTSLDITAPGTTW